MIVIRPAGHRDQAENQRDANMTDLPAIYCAMMNRGIPNRFRGTAGALAAVLFAIALMGQAPDTDETATTAPGSAASDRPVVYVLPITGEINDLTFRFLERGVEAAREVGAQTVVFDVDTPGGLVSSAIDISTLIKSMADIHTVAWVNPEAISAGSLISLAANEIVINKRSKIGDCAAIMVGPQGMQSLGETERAKIDSYILAEFRDSAKANNYPIALCETMVTLGPAVYRIRNTETDEQLFVYEDQLSQYAIDPADIKRFNIQSRSGKKPDTDEEKDSPIDGGEEASVEQADQPIPVSWTIDKLVLKERSLLTMLTDEAVEYGFATAVVETEDELLAHLKLPDAELLRQQPNWSEDLVAWLTSPFVRGILSIILLMALYSEMQAPGLGLAGGVALLAAAILFGAPYLTGLAEAWEIIIVVVGLALLAVEIFFIPGFGVAGISGLLLMFFGLLLTFVPEDPDPGFMPTLPQTWDAVTEGLLTIIISALGATIGMMILARFFGSIPLFRKLILEGQTREMAAGVSAGVGTGLDAVGVKVGDVGHTLSDLRPMGRAEFGSAVYDVTTSGGWISSGSRVRVAEVTGSRIVVEEAD
jgi:membrane-bound serine protease (ClpP class)